MAPSLRSLRRTRAHKRILVSDSLSRVVRVPHVRSRSRTTSSRRLRIAMKRPKARNETARPFSSCSQGKLRLLTRSRSHRFRSRRQFFVTRTASPSTAHTGITEPHSVSVPFFQKAVNYRSYRLPNMRAELNAFEAANLANFKRQID